MRSLAARTAVAAAALALCGSPLPAYLVRRTSSGSNAGAEIRWDLAASAANVVAGKVTFYVDTSDVPDVTPQEFAAAIRSAIQSWEDVPDSVIAFQEDPGRTASQKSSADKVNRFGFSPGVLPPFAFAAAFTAISGSRITDVDVVFNPDMTWAVQTPGDPGAADVEGVTVHEWGHGIGLDHVPLVRSTMYYAASPGQLSLRTPEIDDRAAAAHSYPAPSLATDMAALRGRITGSGGPDERGIQVIALDVVSALPSASSLTSPSGDYEIDGLPPGVYRVMAAPIGTEKIALEAYSPWWNSAGTDFLPKVRGISGTADGTTGTLVLEAGQVLEDVDFAVVAGVDPKEPNDNIAQASPTSLGRSETGRISGFNDHDFYSFGGTAGHTVSILVHAGQIGSDLDPRVYLRNAAGVAIRTNDDISTAILTVEGADSDSRILDFLLPTTGTYHVEVEGATSPDAMRPEDFFYVLTLLEGGTGGASPFTSEISATPAIVPADGASTSMVVFRPRTIQATPLGPGQDVTFDLVFDGDADGTPTAAVDEGDGTYTTMVLAPASPGSDVVRALVDGAPVSTVTVAWRGPASDDGTTFSADPRRIRFDGTSTSTLTLVPRDVNGIPLGPGHTVQFSAPGALSATLGGTTDLGDGSYAATLTAGLDEEDVVVDYAVDGGGNIGPGLAGVGFPLETVVDEVPGGLQEILDADPAPPVKAVPRLTKARDLLLVAGPLTEDGDASAILGYLQKALKQLEAAAKKGGPAPAQAREAVEAAREAALKALAVGILLADSEADLVNLTKAGDLLDMGDALLDAGLRSRAAAKYKSSLVKSRKTM